MWERIKNNPIVLVLVIVIVVFAICWLVGINFHVDAGKSGLHFGVEHGEGAR